MGKYIAETLGTGALVFMGCGAIVVNDLQAGPLGHVGICLVFGLVVLAMIYSVGNISGAHLNPAVTIGFWAARRLEGRRVLPYLCSQCIGAVSAAFLLRLLFAEHPTLGSTLPAGSTIQSFTLEVILSFLLMFVILNVSTGHMEKGIMAGVAIGGTVAMAAMMGGPVSGASMNPARSLGPALICGCFEHLWLYLIAPVAGTILAAPTCRLIQGKSCCYAK
ncbi:MAG: aquaporin [Thermodesulfobacteriota bacterium]|nr:aquaporin [Thermodesulfobacteriota bacterium]